MAKKKKNIQKKWVVRRVECSLSGAFEKLSCLVKRDVEIFNELNPCNKFSFIKNEKDLFCVGRPSHQDNQIAITSKYVKTTLIKKEISVETVVHKTNCQKITIRPVWNKENANCDFEVSIGDENPKILCLNRTSQEIIGDLLFEQLEAA
ncbi:MAG: hypothetical protein OXC57_05595 [Rhodobacteraceae bacterium]|nr:hypothetical protein [Paracoccaceae bacterium]